MSARYISCRQKIRLTHAYTLAQTLPLDASSFDCTNITEALLLAIFLLDNLYGNTADEIIDEMIRICPQFNADQISAEIQKDLPIGLIRVLQPVCINYCMPCEATLYTFGELMDQFPENQPYVIFLIRLSGGLNTPIFRKLFIPYLNPNYLVIYP